MYVTLYVYVLCMRMCMLMYMCIVHSQCCYEQSKVHRRAVRSTRRKETLQVLGAAALRGSRTGSGSTAPVCLS